MGLMLGSDTAMRAVTVDSAMEFLSQTEKFRAEEPLLTNLIGTVAAAVAAGRRYDECFWWVDWRHVCLRSGAPLC